MASDSELSEEAFVTEHREKRQIKYTQEGRQFFKETKCRTYELLFTRAERQLKRLEPLTASVDNVHIVQDNLGILDEIVSDLQRAYIELVTFLNDELEDQTIITQYEERFKRLEEFQIATKAWVSEAKREMENQLETKSMSLVSRSSRRSKRSSRSNNSILSALAKERAKSAELKAKAEILQRKQALNNEVEKLRLEEELAVAKAREEVLVKADNTYAESVVRKPINIQLPEESKMDLSGVARIAGELPRREKVLDCGIRANPDMESLHLLPPRAMAESTFARKQERSNLATRLSPFSPPVSTIQGESPSILPQPLLKRDPNNKDGAYLSDVLVRQNELMSMLVEQHRQTSLPPLQIEKFSGDSTQYTAFIRCFEDQIECRLLSNETKLRYLEQYLDGEAKELIKGCVHMDGGYLQARRLLKENYGDPYKIANAFLQKASEWPILKYGDDKGLNQFSVFLIQCCSMKSLSYMKLLDHPHSIQNLVTKLPLSMQERWRREAKAIHERGQEITLADLSKLVKNEVDLVNDPIFSRSTLSRISGQEKTKMKPRNRSDSRHTVSATTTNCECQTDSNEISCPLCHGSHDLESCKQFLGKSLEGRRSWLKDNKLCYACFNLGHTAKGCCQRRKCKKCPGKHPTTLHDDNFSAKRTRKRKEELEQKTTYTCDTVEESSCHVSKRENCIGALPIVPVKLTANGKEVMTYAMLDSCSTGTFIRDDIREKLGETGTETNLIIKTINGSEHHSSIVLNNLAVTDINGENMIKLPRTYTREEIPASSQEIPRPETVKNYPYLKRIASQIHEYLPGSTVGLLIGFNCPQAIEPKDFVASEQGGPYAIKTFAGWTVVGPLQPARNESYLRCSRISVKEVNTDVAADHHFAFESQVKEIITPSALNKMMELEFNERSNVDSLGYSADDKKFLTMMNNDCIKVDGHYQVPLPLRNKDLIIPNNREQVLQRMKWLKRKLQKNKKLYEDYNVFMKDIITKGYARKISEDREPLEGKLWYIPHHGVYHAKKPEKIRVVYNCSAKFHGTSLNEQLIQGPDLTSTLIGVLTRFRQKPIAFAADIESMFYQVHVPDHQRDLLRFLWWPGGDLTKNVEDYQMNVHLFGAISSPSCSNFCLKKAAEDSIEEVGIDTADVLTKNFYVDDCLCSEETDYEAIQRLKGVQHACARGGFRLTKFVSNSRKVLNSVPEEDRSNNLRTVDLDVDQLPIERALGVYWSVQSDTFEFRIIMNDKPPTRRGILSAVSSLYDPLGMLAPFVLIGKRILQDLCKINIDWDDVIPEEYKVRWERWRRELVLLVKFVMPRCLKPENFGRVVVRQLHHFSDASTVGYGQVSYVRVINDKGEIHCSFLIGKARVTPTKAITVPRLELVAATTSVRIGNMLKKELDDPIDQEFYWTDSTTVLRYILNECKRFQLFVANRVQTIRDNTEVDQWHHVEGRLNPADDASRGLHSEHLLNSPRWIKGPEFLWQPEAEWPQSSFDEPIPNDDPEVRKVLLALQPLKTTITS